MFFEVIDSENCRGCPLYDSEKFEYVPWEVIPYYVIKNIISGDVFDLIGYTPDRNKKDVESLFSEFSENGFFSIVLVGEAPGFTERLKRRPFIGKAGAVLRSTLVELIRELRDDMKEFDFNIFITNACKCVPEKDGGSSVRPPVIQEIEVCRVNLKKDLTIASPILLIALGKTASLALGIPNEKLESIRGLHETSYGPVYVTYHPSAVIRNNFRNYQVFKRDLKNALVIAIERLKEKLVVKETTIVGNSLGKSLSNSLSESLSESSGKLGKSLGLVSCRIEPIVITSTSDLVRAFKDLDRVLNKKGRFRATVFDYETCPFSWTLLPSFDVFLLGSTLDPCSELSDIAFTSIAYVETEGDEFIYRSFSFPVRAYVLFRKYEDYVKKRIDELTEKRQSILEKVLDVYRDLSKGLRRSLLDLYFLYEEYGISPDVVEDVYEKMESEKSEAKFKLWFLSMLNGFVREYRNFLFNLARLEKEFQERFDVEERVAIELLRRYLLNRSIVKVAHNIQFEYVFSVAKLDVRPEIFSGTDILDYFCGNTTHSLSELEKRYILPILDKVEGYLAKDESRLLGKTCYGFALYNAYDSAKTLLIYYRIKGELREMLDRNVKLDNSYVRVSFIDAIKSANEFIVKVVVPFAVDAHLFGIRLDVEVCKELANRIHEIIEVLLEKVRTKLGVSNVRDDVFRQKLYSMYEKGMIVTKKDKKPSISKDALLKIYETTKNEELKEIVLYVYSIHKYENLLSKYVEKYPFYLNPYTKRVHPWYNITKTMSGRLSCRDPNIQQVPREPFMSCPRCYVVPLKDTKACPLCGESLEVLIDFRTAFVAEDGKYLVMADYSQIEMAVLAELSKDETLIQVINSGYDMHSYNASNIYGISYEEIKAKKDVDPDIARLRQNAKRVTFAVIYGASEEGIAAREDIDPSEARLIIDKFFESYPKTKEWIERRHEEARKYGVVLVPTGRPRWLVKVEEEGIERAMLRRAQNTPIQGFASDINLVSCEILKREYGMKVIGAIHDSILVEIDEEDVGRVDEIFGKVVERTINLRDSLRDIIGAKKVSEFVENLKVKLNIDVRVGKTWKDVK